MVHRRDIGGEVLVFGIQGDLWGNAMTWWDHSTGTVWSQPLGESIVGPRKGDRLELVTSQLTRWGTWRSEHPESLALDVAGGSSGFTLETLSIVVDFGTEVGVYAMTRLGRDGPANDVIAGMPIAVVVDPSDWSRWSVLHRALGDNVLTLETVGDETVDVETGNAWDPANGRALDGPLEGEILHSLPSFTAPSTQTQRPSSPTPSIGANEDGNGSFRPEVEIEDAEIERLKEQMRAVDFNHWSVGVSSG